jgi:tRNA modification GTPase
MRRYVTPRTLNIQLTSYARCWRSASLGKAVAPWAPHAGIRPLATFSHINHEFPTLSGSGQLVHDDTIYAVSTAPGRAGIAIIRTSGPSCTQIYKALCPGRPLPRPRYASLRTLYDPTTQSAKEILDSDALILYFPSPKTVTGEEVLELHIHGGPATVKAVLQAIPKCSSDTTIRYAEPGEFTRRAFTNGRLDLAQVEALSDTLAAETEQQRRAAVRGNSGALGRAYEAWRQQLLEARGELEAIIDFSEDQYFEEGNEELLANINETVDHMVSDINLHEEGSRRGELLRKGIRVSMLGHPNAGKSSLLNLIVGREAAIVSPEAGTTRDVVEVSLDVRGYFCTFADTAGLRSGANGTSEAAGEVVGNVELEGIRRAKAKAAESDLVLVMASVEPRADCRGWEIYCDADALETASQARNALLVVNKIDLAPPEQVAEMLDRFNMVLLRQGYDHLSDHVVPVSCRTAQESSGQPGDAGSIGHLVEYCVGFFKDMTVFEEEDLLGVTERQRQLLEECKGHCDAYLETAKSSSTGEVDIVLAAEHLRSAAHCLSRITGRGDAGDVEEVLGVVFEKYVLAPCQAQASLVINTCVGFV